MAHRWGLRTWPRVSKGFPLWRRLARKSAASCSMSGASHCRILERQPYCYKGGCLSCGHVQQQRITGRKGWFLSAGQSRQRLGLHTSSLYLNTSASRWSASLSQHMSRVRSTLDTVSKAVSGTHSELLSKITRLKPKVLKTGKQAEATVESTAKVDEAAVTPTPPPNDVTPSSPATKPTFDSALPSSPVPTSAAATFDASASASTHPVNSPPPAVGATALTARDPKDKKLRRVVPPVKAGSARKQAELKLPANDAESKNATTKQTTALFHPSTFSVSLDETYNYLAHHINSYFGFSAKNQAKNVDRVDNSSASSQGAQASSITSVSDKTASAAPVAPATSKKGLGHYLSYSAPTVQAFVGNYIAPLVPKFRTSESKSAVVAEKKLEDAPAKQIEATITAEQKVAEEKAKKLLLQREKIIAKVSVDNRTRALVQGLYRASDVRVFINRVEDLSYHLLQFPDTCGVAVKEKVIPRLLRLKQADDPGLRAAVREALSLVGYHAPIKGRGIRILSIDGGGLRGLLALQTLNKLEALTGKPIHKLFDYICGVSTGAILGFMLGVFQIPLSECDDLYRKLGSDIFKQNVIVGTVKMGWKHAFYDSEAWENLLKEKMGSHLLVETTRNPDCPKVAAVSTIVNRGPLKAYVFRNYNFLPGVRPLYLGGCQHQLWQAIRATSAAPGYFQEFPLGDDLHQDGGLLINNPTALAVHECKCLWPDTPLECVVSLGTGRMESLGKTGTTSTSLKTKLNNVISSATDTEEVHAMLDAFLPADTYYRFNPYMSEDVSMDESRQEKLGLLQAEGARYLERNEHKLSKVARILTREKSPAHRVSEWARLRVDMYSGRSFNWAKI
ncbi:calcium-independent phospholipase A2-gamma-like isoform X1 [Nelusetta ayraudi]|uniref:calcium-independent phospholipase A2-gamma-like isoform X1 n=2 Tax=Nelusetta ayraudi TaxID=303726 RepID=UPI003F72B427